MYFAFNSHSPFITRSDLGVNILHRLCSAEISYLAFFNLPHKHHISTCCDVVDTECSKELPAGC